MTTRATTYLASESSASVPSGPAAPISRSLGWLAVGVLVLLWAYAVYRLGALWYSNKHYAYGWFVPLLCLGLFWERWQRRPAPEPIEGAAGPVILWGALLLSFLPTCLFLEVIPNWRFAGWAFAGAIIGISLCALYLIGGRSWLHHFALPLVFLLIAVPWPSRIEAPLILKLSHLNAAVSTWAANWLGTPAIRQGVVIETGTGKVGVDQACSGIRSFQAAVMVALFLGELYRYSFFRRLFFLLSGIALAFGCNVVRTTYLVRVCDLKGMDAVNTAHDPAGFTILGITLAGLLVLAWLFRGKRKEEEKAESTNTKAETLKTEMLKGETEEEKAESGKQKLETKSEKLKAEMLKGDLKAESGKQKAETTKAESAAEREVRTRWAEDDEVGQASAPAGPTGESPGGEAVPSGGTPPGFAGEDACATLGARRPGVALGVALVSSVFWILAVGIGIEAWFRTAERQAISMGSWSLQLPTQQPEFQQPQIRDGARDMLQYDEGQQAEWRQANGRPWQLYYLRWHPARTRYHAIDIARQAYGHAPDLCLQLAGMTLRKNVGRRIRHVNGVSLSTDLESFSDQGRPLHVLSCYWEPNATAPPEGKSASPSSTANGIRNAWHALQIHERGRNEKRVIKIGVWGMETDEEAEAAFREFLQGAIVNTKGKS